MRSCCYAIIFYFRLGESEGSYCTLATFPSDSSSESSSSTPSPSPPVTPLQEKPKKVQKPTHQRYNSLDYPHKYRNHSNMAVSSLRVKPSPREVNTFIKYVVLFTVSYTNTVLLNIGRTGSIENIGETGRELKPGKAFHLVDLTYLYVTINLVDHLTGKLLSV